MFSLSNLWRFSRGSLIHSLFQSIQLLRNNYLENALRFEDSEKVRKHFEANGFSQTPPPPVFHFTSFDLWSLSSIQIMSLLNRAMDFVLETVLFRADDLDTGITNELRVFIIKKQEVWTTEIKDQLIISIEARVLMLEVIFNRPDLMPTKWGGARAEVRSKNCKFQRMFQRISLIVTE